MEHSELYVQNLIDAFRQLNQFLGLGLAASVSALALELGSRVKDEDERISVPGAFVQMNRQAAQLVLMGLGFVAGAMGSYTAESAAKIVSVLECAPCTLKAAASFASIATSPVGVSVIATTLPVAFVLPVFWRRWRASRNLGVPIMFVLFAMVYGVTGWVLARMPVHPANFEKLACS